MLEENEEKIIDTDLTSENAVIIEGNIVKKFIINIMKFIKLNKKVTVFAGVNFLALLTLIVFFISTFNFNGSEGVIKKEEIIKKSVIIFESIITPTSASEDGVNIDSNFIILGEKFNSIDSLLSKLSVNTTIKYSAIKSIDSNYKLTFANKLEKNKIYNFVFKDDKNQETSYAFQTKPDFEVDSTFPRDYANEVPTNSGIEITFTNSDIENYEDYITMSPAVTGKFSKVGNTIIFAPEKLTEGIKYYVTIKKGLKTKSGEILKKDYTFSFYTKYSTAGRDYVQISEGNTETFLTKDIPVVEIRATDTYNNINFNTEIVEVTDYHEYIDLLKKAKENYDKLQNSDTSTAYQFLDYKNGKKISNFSSKLILTETASEIKYIVLPSALPEGYYILNITGEKDGKKTRLQKFIQCHDYVVYAKTDKKSTLVWVNDANTLGPLTGAELFLDNVSVGKTLEDGTCNFNISGEKKVAQLVVKGSSSKPFVTTINLSPSSEKQAFEKYYTYLYTDRSAYLSSEKIKVFGFLKSRDGTPIPKQLKLMLGSVTRDWSPDYGYKTSFNIDEKVAESSVNISESGTFSAELKIDKLISTIYDVCLIGDNSFITNTTIEVFNYVKPLYTIEHDNISKMYFNTEKIPFGATVSYFGGNPAVGLPFNISLTGRDIKKDVITDDKGKINVQLDCNIDNTDSYNKNDWKAFWASVKLECTSPEDKVQTFEDSYYILPRTVMITGDVKTENNVTNVVISTNHITKDKVNKEKKYDYDNYDILRGAPINIPVTVRLKKKSYTKTSKGTFYDYIEKKTYEKFDYKEVESLVSEKVVNTIDGQYVLENVPQPEANGTSYYYDFECKDTKNRPTVERVYLPSIVIQNQTNIKEYNFSDFDSDVNNFRYELNDYSVGDEISLNLLDEKAIKVQTGNVLFNVMKEGIFEQKIYTSFPLKVNYKEDYIPNIYVNGAYFDGKRVYKIEYKTIGFNNSSRSLNIDVKSDKTSYNPGDTVNLTIYVEDINKLPREADMNISVVDEAQFAVAPQTADVLGFLYKNYFQNGEMSEYVSYRQHSFNGVYGGGGGGGGGPQNAPRIEFVDNAAFLNIKSDKNGDAKVSFKLPDNITSWRITAHAISNDLFAGNTKININSNLPFVSDMIVNRTYLTQDDVTILARAYGTALVSDKTATFTATLTNDKGLKITKTATAKAFDSSSFNFGQQKEGEYKLTLNAQQGNFVDAIEKSFSVVKNATEIYLSKTFDLKKSVDINAVKSPVNLMIYNKGSSLINSTLNNLFYSSGKRNDQIVARSASAKMLSDMASEDDKKYYNVSDKYTSGDFQLENGGAAIYSYATDDPLLTAKLILVDPSCIDNVKAIKYFNNILSNSEEKDKSKIAAAYLGLAAYKQPVLNKIKVMLKSTSKTDYKTISILICGLVAIGDDGGATEAFNKYLNDKVVVLKNNTAYLNCSKIEIDNYNLTTLSLIYLSEIDKETAEKIMKYTLQNPSKYDFYGLEQIIYAKNMISLGTTQGIFEYQINGEKRVVTLKNSQIKNIMMTTEQLKNASFRVNKGDLEVKAVFVGTSDNLDRSTATIDVKKEIKVVNSKFKDGKIHIGDKLRVSITVKLPKNGEFFYDIKDFIPSGMRFVSFDAGSSSLYAWLSKTEGQNVCLGISNPYKDINAQHISYFIRAVTEGSYLVDNAFAVSSNDYWGFSKQEKIMIIK